MPTLKYTEDQIRSLDWKTHIRLRPGMYIGQLGDGSTPEDGIYMLFKEVIDNSVDEYVMGHGKRIDITTTAHQVTVRDYGRGIPLGKLIDCVARINTGGKYDTKAFKKSIGLNGVGLKAVNALSSHFQVTSYRDGKGREVTFSKGELVSDKKLKATGKKDGTAVIFQPDKIIFEKFAFSLPILAEKVANFSFLNTGLQLMLNGKRYVSQKGLQELLSKKIAKEARAYPIIHLQDTDIELAITHQPQVECYFTFVNGQFTPQGGNHLTALKEALVKHLRLFYKKNWEGSDIRQGLAVAFSIRIQDPVFESQTKTKLGSNKMGDDGTSVRVFVNEFIQKHLDNYLHQNADTAKALLGCIKIAEQERKALSGIKKLARERAKKAKIHNKKLRDCTIHYASKHVRREETTLFITEGNSASGSITQVRDVATQAVFSLRGKPLNCFGQSRKIVYENEEFNLLQHALNIEKGVENLRYNKIILATDADVDGMHIRLLLLTYFLQFFPEVVQDGHLYILETPLFRVRNTKKSFYCYDEAEKLRVLKKVGAKAEVTRFKGLGEISSHEFKHFIGDDMRLTPVRLLPDTPLANILSFYMGKNTPVRQDFIINHLRVEE